jgi:RNA polymerase sigma-70 factor (ECF subfamily)
LNGEAYEAELIHLLGRVAQQDRQAFRDLYDRTAPKLLGLAMRVVRNSEHAQDIVQDAYVQIWRIAADYEVALSPPLTWLGLIVRSRALDFLRRRASERIDVHQELEGYITDTVAQESPGPLDLAQSSEQAWALHQCLERLELKQREVVSLAYLRDLSHSELATQLSLPLGTVKTWIRRGIDQLRGCMARFA